MLLYIVFFACIFTKKIVLLYNVFVYSIYLGFMKINQWIFYSLFLGLISCQSQEQTFTVHYTGLGAYEGDTVYLWRYGADRMTGDRDYGKAPLDFAIIRNGEVSFSGKEDTLHIYGMEHPGSMNFFYPERGELTLTNVVPPAMPVSDKSTNLHSQNVRLWKLWHEDDFPLEATRQFVFDNARNAIGWMVFDRWAAIYPDELETLYQKTPSQMRDSTSVLIGLKRMLDATRSLKPGDHFIDFKQVEYGEKDSLLFSDIAGQGHSVCLLFFLKPNEKDAVRTEIKNLREQYPDIRIIVPTYRYPDPESKEFIHELETVYQATILDDSRRFEKSARWKYRIYGSFNYEYLFDAQGQLVKMKPVL